MISSLRTQLWWLACFAVLFNLLAMPLDRALRVPSFDSQSLLLGSFCSLHTVPAAVVKQLYADLDLPDDSAPQHSKQPSGDCCCGHAGQAFVPGHYAKQLFPRYWSEALLLGHAHLLPLPRQQWPDLSPRAPPLS